MQLCLDGQWVLVMDFETGVCTLMNSITLKITFYFYERMDFSTLVVFYFKNE